MERPDTNGAATTAADDALASELRIAVMRLTRRLRAERTDETLTLSQLSAMSSLSRHGPCSPGQLADIERVQPPSMTRVIAGLEDRKLVVRAAHETDKRQAVIELSAEGRAVLETNRAQREAWLARMLDGLSVKERSMLRAALPILERLGDS